MDRSATRRLLLIGLGTLAVPLDTALNIAFPAITAHFGLALSGIQWLVICYVLTHGSMMLGFGRLGDLLGHARVFRVGLAWSAVALLLCAAAPSYEWLLVFRALQGIGAALVISCGPALVTGLFPETQRARLLGFYALVFALGGALGPALGGALVAAWGWPAVFWFRAPLALLALLLLLRDMPAPPRAAQRAAFDARGAGLLALSIGSALLALNQLRWIAAGGLGAMLLAVAAIAAGWAFRRHNRRSSSPVIPLGLSGLPGFVILNAANALANLAGFAVLLFVPYFLTRLSGMESTPAGLVLAMSPMGTALAAVAGGRLLATGRAVPIMAAGIALTGLGSAAMASWSATTPLPLLLGALFLHGLGLGLLQVSYTDTVTATLPRQDRGVAGSLAMMTRMIGIVAGASLLTLLFDTVEAALPDASAENAFLRAFRFCLAAAALLCFALLPWLRRVPARG